MTLSPALPRDRRSWWRALAGVALFAFAYALANRFQLVNGVLYRWAANDAETAVLRFALLALQGAALLGAAWLLPRKWFAVVLALAFASILVNLGYGQTVHDTLDAMRLAWLAEESRQAGAAAGEFAVPLLLAGAMALAAVTGLFVAQGLLQRGLGRPRFRCAALLGLALLVMPNLAAWVEPRAASAAERNVYALGVALLTAEPPPPRAPVGLEPVTAGTPRHIVWLIDESVTHAPFARIVLPSAAPHAPVDFGEAVSMGNCSAPANVALRSGVDVRQAGPKMDLRATPSIWGYARKAGYRTVLIDGQTPGAPQNMLLPPELELIDEVEAMDHGIDTDRAIARHLNAQFRKPGRSFTYAVLRGVHFQYRDHVPPGTLPDDASAIEAYRAALAYSKDGFFEALFDGVERSEVAVIYTSDHGQNLAPGALPHCSERRIAAEYMVPLLAFLPDPLAARFTNPSPHRHSLSQVFPTTLEWMGYEAAAVQARYDHDLTAPPAAWVRFGRGVVPLQRADRVEVMVSKHPPR